MQKLLDLGRIDVLAAANDQLLASAHDAIGAAVSSPRQVTREQPAVRVDGAARGFRISVIAGHHAMAAGAKLTGGVRRSFGTGGGVDQLDLEPRNWSSDRADP